MYQRYRQLLPVLLLLGFCVSTIIQGLIGTIELDGVAYDFSLNAKHYGAIALTAVAVASFFPAAEILQVQPAAHFWPGSFWATHFHG
jgi:hypothetical protein